MSEIKFDVSKSHNNWGTPQKLFDNLNKEFNFTLDPCSNNKNFKIKKHYTEEDNGLSKDWSKDIVFMNPPYGREIKFWIKKEYEEYKKGSIVVCLIPARSTDTAYWHNYIFKYAKEIRFIKSRLSFCGYNRAVNKYTEQVPCMHPSCIVIFDKNDYKYPLIKSIDIEGNEIK